MKNKNPRPIELLAPARNAEIAISAIIHGADAVYIGSEGFGARAAAGNPVDDIKRVVEFAHKFHAKVYVTFNTLIYENELSAARELVFKLYHAGVDALIVQDLSLLGMDIPPIQLHASTQADARTPEKAWFLQQAGFSQIVLPREMTLGEIAEVSRKVSVPLEAFVHGALCVSYSGACKASFLASGRSANRGECAQMCRQSYTLEDSSGNAIISDRHLLSLKDMNRMEYLSQMMEAGISSFKIEGRLKDESYVKNVVAAYRLAIDKIIEANPDKYRRASIGETSFSFTPDVNSAFNRGFTPYFLDCRKPVSMANFNTPKSIGTPVGKIVSCKGNSIIVRSNAVLANGDGLGYFTKSGEFKGFRANKVEDNRIIYVREKLDFISANTILYRNRDTRRDAELARKDTARRIIPVDMTLSLLPDNRIAADIKADGFRSVTVAMDADISPARTPVLPDARRKVIAKLGDTVFSLRDFEDRIPLDNFIPNSILANLRRLAAEALESGLLANRPLSLPAPRHLEPGTEGSETAENVANSVAAKIYRDLKSSSIIPAAEIMDSRQLSEKDFTVMECRYCLRRELNACLQKKEEASRLPSPIFIRTGNIRYRLDFNCKKCEMKVIANPK